MTRDEQVNWLCRLRADLNNGVIFTPWNKEFAEALTGILEQEPRKGEVILTNKEYRELLSNEFDNGYAKGYREALEQEEQEPTLEK